MKYFLMDCYPNDTGLVISQEPLLDDPLDNWMGGARFEVPVPEPLEFFVDEEDEGEMLPFFNIGSFVIVTPVLEETLMKCGADNFESYEAELHIRRTKEVFRYRAVNIIGILSATNLASSVGVDVTKDLGVSGIMSMFFKKIVLDEDKIHGLKMFRLAESPSKIFVSEEVKMCIESSEDGKFQRLDFTDTEIMK